jgi:two-component system alkaline phosphatase synthesis response regulator PhoP
MAGNLVLVVEDDPHILELVTFHLKRDGFRVHPAADGEEALSAADSISPDIIVLDLMLPGVDGLEVCRRLKQNKDTGGIPIIILTAKSEDADVVAGLELGADDHITKPFSPRVFVARVRAVLRRESEQGPQEQRERIATHGIVIDLLRHQVTVDSSLVELSATEFSILELLAKNPGSVFSHSKIIDEVKGQDYPVTDRSVDVHILGLRRKLGQKGSVIETVRGVGYRLRAE